MNKPLIRDLLFSVLVGLSLAWVIYVTVISPYLESRHPHDCKECSHEH